MSLIQRTQDILLKPRETWEQIASEQTPIASLYRDYLIVLFAVPALCTFIGNSLFGQRIMGISVRVPLVQGMVLAVVSYVVSLGATFAFALVIDALAPTFGGTRNLPNAFALAAYSATAACLGGIFQLVPAISALGLLAFLYSIYVLYIGLPVLTKCPQDKSIAYTIVSGICLVVAALIVGAVLGTLGLRNDMNLHDVTGGRHMTIDTGQGSVTVNTSKLPDGTTLERFIQKAQQTDRAARQPSAAPAPSSHAVTSPARALYSSDQLKPLLPDTILNIKHGPVATASDTTSSTAAAEYRDGARMLTLSFVDIGPANPDATVSIDSEEGDSVLKVYQDHGRSVHETYQKDGSDTRISVQLTSGLVVTIAAQGYNEPTLMAVLYGLGLDRIEAMPRPVKP